MKKWIMFALFCTAAVLGLGILFEKAATHTATEQKAVTSSKMPEGALDANAAQTTFKQNCMSCHGTELQGGAGPNLQKVGGKLTPEQIYKKIESGGGVMPSFKTQLKNEDVANLARWLGEKK
jgi:mono/diheme cytochrome c family protein